MPPVPTSPSGGGSGGGYARKLIQGVLPANIKRDGRERSAGELPGGTPAGPGGTNEFRGSMSALPAVALTIGILGHPRFMATAIGNRNQWRH